MTIKSFIISSAIIFAIGFAMAWSIKPIKRCPEITPSIVVEYKYITKTDTLIIPKFRTVINTDTVRYSDTIFVHNETQYIAEIDTTYEDSTLTAHIQFVSPIKLSPKSYFNLKFNVREATVTNTVVQTEEVGFFYKRFIPYLGIGLSYNGKTVEPALQLGFGVRIN